MGLNKLLQFFVTKETKFYPIYMKQAETIQNASKLLRDMVLTDDVEERKILGRQIKKNETDGDEQFRKLYQELNNTFITPFDREDVHDLGSNMDDFLDVLEDCSKAILMYHPKKLDKQILEIATYLYENSQHILEITKHLDSISEKSHKIIELCDKIKHNEHIVDDIYTNYISHLFESQIDYTELIKDKNIAETFELASDAAKQVSDTFRTIIIKNS
ncbi:MAG: DUF47 domain-containing protein [Candidatus Limimorpha sp.]